MGPQAGNASNRAVLLLLIVFSRLAFAQLCFPTLPCSNSASSSGSLVSLANTGPGTTLNLSSTYYGLQVNSGYIAANVNGVVAGVYASGQNYGAVGFAQTGVAGFAFGSGSGAVGVLGSTSWAGLGSVAGKFDGTTGDLAIHALGRSQFDGDLASTGTVRAASGRFGVLSGPKVNAVECCGATGDGIADDTAALQAAINMVAAQGGGVVFLPKGVYRLSAPLTISSSHVAMQGMWESTTLLIDSALNDGLVIGPSFTAPAASDIRIENLVVVRPQTTTPSPSAAGIRVSHAYGTQLHNLRISRHGVGIEVGNPLPGQSVDSTWLTRIRYCFFEGVHTGASISFLSTADAFVTDSFFGAIRESPTPVGIRMSLDSNGIRLDSLTMLGGHQIFVSSEGNGFARFISNSVLDTPGSFAIFLGGSGSGSIQVTGNWISQNGTTLQRAIYGSPGAGGLRDLTIANNYIKSSAHGIYLSGAEALVVSNNILDNCAENPPNTYPSIEIRKSTDVLITGNAVRSYADTFGLDIDSATTRVVVLGNNFGAAGPGMLISSPSAQVGFNY